MSLLWLNGQLIDKAVARVSPFDHGFLYGDGVWEPLRIFGGRLFRAEDHLKHLIAAANVMSIDIPLSQPELLAAIETTVRANNRAEGYVRVIVSRGPGTIGPDPRKIEPQLMIIAEEYQPFPAELYAHGLHLVTTADPMSCCNPYFQIRTLGQLDVLAAKRHALANGCLDCVLLGTRGEVWGATEGKVLVVSKGRLMNAAPWPAEVTQELVNQLAADAGIQRSSETPVHHQLMAADEAFLAGTSCGVIGIVRVDGQDIGSGTEGPITREIRERYHARTRVVIG